MHEGAQGALCFADDPQLAEFLQLMQPRRAGNIWSNEDVQLAQKGSKAAAAAALPQAQLRATSTAAAAKAPGIARSSQHVKNVPKSTAGRTEVQQDSASAGEHSVLLLHAHCGLTCTC